MRTVPCVIMRGGTSKAPFLDAMDLPRNQQQRDALLLRLLGSPDPRQIDGLGGATPLTSKVVVMDRAAPRGCDATYTYGRVSITEGHIGYASNCGNLSAAAGVYAVEQGLVTVGPGPTTPVRLFNSNTNRVLTVHVPTQDGRYVAAGDFAIAGVPGSGAEIRLDFTETAGVLTGRLLPFGPTTDVPVPELGIIPVSVVDVAKPAVFFRAEDIGMTGTERPGDVDESVVARYWAVRDAVAGMLDLDAESAHLPTPIAVAPAAGYAAFGTGVRIRVDEVDLTVRAALRRGYGIHQAIAGTSAVCTAVAAALPGTVVNAVVREFRGAAYRLGTPSGPVPVRAEVGPDGQLAEASFSRTARTIARGTAYVP